MKTTVDTPNRVRDREMISMLHPLLSEFPERLLNFYSPNGSHLATDYTRVVYGDHGPYIEFRASHIYRPAWKVKRLKGDKAWYDECTPKDGSNCLLYVQKRTVSNLPNPPRGKWSCNNNRPEGYADYKVGMLYISPFKVSILDTTRKEMRKS